MNVFAVFGRIALAAIFVFSGVAKLIDIPAAAAALSKIALPEATTDLAGQLESLTGMPTPQLLAILVGLVELLGGILIIFNVGARFAAVLLIIFTIIATYYFHDFWNQTGVERTGNLIHSMKNLSIIGGLMLVMAMGRLRPADKIYD